MNLKIKCTLGESVAAGGKTMTRESGKGWSTGKAAAVCERQKKKEREGKRALGRDGQTNGERARRRVRAAGGRLRTGRRRACAVREGQRRRGDRRAEIPSGLAGPSRDHAGRSTRWDARRPRRGEGAATRRRCVSLLAPANCRGQPALAEELTELSRILRKQASRHFDSKQLA